MSARLLPQFADVPADYDFVIIGAGPAGIAAAAEAHAQGARYVLLEATAGVANTIRGYQKGKYVMAEPAHLPLISSVPFSVGTREQVLGNWEKSAAGLEVRYGARMSRLAHDPATGTHTVMTESGDVYTARCVVLAAGVQGNLRKLGVPGESLPRVQYTLADPDEINGETVVVVGGGDAGVENAIALIGRNTVYLINRDEEFARCKEGNIKLIEKSKASGQLLVKVSTNTLSVREDAESGRLVYAARGPLGEEEIACDRIIARLGTLSPRKELESYGIAYPGPAPDATPLLSERYESSVPGLFVLGALSGCPLIKQAMNQGREVVAYACGKPVEPADEGLLREVVKPWRPRNPVGETLALIAERVPLFQPLGRLQLREVLLESRVQVLRAGDVVFRQNDYTNSFYSIVEGEVEALVDDKRVGTLQAGMYFGEIGLISGRRRTATIRAIKPTVVIETSRRTILKLIASVDGVRQNIDENFVRRALALFLGGALTPADIDVLLAEGYEVRRYQPHQDLFREGDPGDGLYLIRRGSVTVTKQVEGRPRVLAYLAAGNYVGEMSLINKEPRAATVTAAVMTEVLVVSGKGVEEVRARNAKLAAELGAKTMRALRESAGLSQLSSGRRRKLDFLLGQGLGEATDLLLIDESRCIHCNQCENACAATHDGVSRLDRVKGPSFDELHVPTACRHCENPHCMKECPPDAIKRLASGEVVINDSCIGCGNCQSNCPYGVIQLAPREPQPRPGLLMSLLFGVGGKARHAVKGDVQKKAVKCDMCRSLPGGAACVRACPTGAAMRLSAEAAVRSITGR